MEHTMRIHWSFDESNFQSNKRTQIAEGRYFFELEEVVDLVTAPWFINEMSKLTSSDGRCVTAWHLRITDWQGNETNLLDYLMDNNLHEVMHQIDASIEELHNRRMQSSFRHWLSVVGRLLK